MSIGFTTVAVGAGTTVLGQSVTPFNQTSTVPSSTPLASYYKSTGGGLTFYGDNDSTDLVTAQTVPYAELLYPVAVGVQSTVTVNNIPTGTTSSGDPLTTSFVQTATVSDFETVSVDAGVFANTAKQVFSQTGTITDTKTGQSIPYSGTQTTWLAPNVGIVKVQATTAAGGTTISTENLGLRGYTLNGTTHGLGDPFTLIPNPFSRYSTMTGVQPATATNGSIFLTAIASTSGGIIGQMNDSSGALLGKLTFWNANSSVATWFDGSNFEVATVWNSGSAVGLYVQRVTPSGQQLDAPSGYLATTYSHCVASQYVIAVAPAPSGALVLTYCVDNTDTPQIVGVLVNSNGQPSAGGDFVIYSPVGANTNPVVAFNGTNFLVSWMAFPSAGGALYGLRVSQTGSVLDASPVLIGNVSPPTSAMPPSMASDGTNYFLAWEEQRNPGDAASNLSEIYGARISPALTLLDGTASSPGFLLSVNGARGRYDPVVAYNGTEFLAAWEDDNGDPSEVLGVTGVRVSTSGVLTSGAGFEIAISGPEINPASGLSQTSNTPLYLLLSMGASPNATLITWTPLNEGLAGVIVNPF